MLCSAGHDPPGLGRWGSRVGSCTSGQGRDRGWPRLCSEDLSHLPEWRSKCPLSRNQAASAEAHPPGTCTRPTLGEWGKGVKASPSRADFMGMFLTEASTCGCSQNSLEDLWKAVGASVHLAPYPPM